MYELDIEYERKEDIQDLSLKTEKIVFFNIVALDCVKEVGSYMHNQEFRVGHVNFEIFIRHPGEMLIMRYLLIS